MVHLFREHPDRVNWACDCLFCRAERDPPPVRISGPSRVEAPGHERESVDAGYSVFDFRFVGGNKDNLEEWLLPFLFRNYPHMLS